jgi:hypothetical protein
MYWDNSSILWINFNENNGNFRRNINIYGKVQNAFVFLLNLSLVLQFRLDSIETRRVRKVNGELMHNIGANILDPS